MRTRRSFLALALALILAPLLAQQTAASVRAADPCAADARYFEQTGFCVSGLFYDYWAANGGLAQQGLPLSKEFAEVNPSDNKTYSVQYFERARFEYHPENAAPYNVLLGLLGGEQYKAKYPNATPASGGSCPPGTQQFAQTNRCVSGLFYAYWAAHGGLAQQGLPLGAEFAEVNPSDGKTYNVQYFERARFEYHPENAAPYNVLLGLLGGEQYKAKYGGGQPSPAPASSGSPAPAPLPGAQLTISPQQGPNGTLFVVTATGLAPNTSYFLQLINRDTNTRITFDNAAAKSNANGIIIGGFSFGGNVPAGSYAANIATAAEGGTILATTNFTLTGATGAKPGPNIVITPPQGAAGGRFALTGTGFTVKTTYTLRIQTENRQTTVNFDNSDVVSDADGVILSTFTLAAARPAGVYIAEIISKGATPQVMTGVKFTLTAASAGTPTPSSQPSPSTQPAPAPSPSTSPAPMNTDQQIVGAAFDLIQSVPKMRYIVDNLISRKVVWVFSSTLPDNVFGSYNLRSNTITYGAAFRTMDIHDLAALTGHEGQHAYDFYQFGPPNQGEQCYTFELRGFLSEAILWNTWYGPQGKANPANDFEREENAIMVDVFYNDGKKLIASILKNYADECGQRTVSATAVDQAPFAISNMQESVIAAASANFPNIMPTLLAVATGRRTPEDAGLSNAPDWRKR